MNKNPQPTKKSAA